MTISVENLTKRYGAGAPAVSQVSFQAPLGAITSLIGPSGAGKSTVLRLIAGLELPDEGVIRIAGADCSSLSIQGRGVGLVFQSYALFQNMTVRQNVAFGLDVRKLPRAAIRERVSELLRLVQLEGYGERYPSQLSGGQKQRVAFARALAISPKVLLLDEPFGALDARVRRELREWLERLHDETHLTTLLVTHDQDEALEVSQHVVLMQDGRVVQTGTPQQIYDHPATPAAAAFLGASVLRVQLPHASTGGRHVIAAPPGHGDDRAVDAYVRPHEVRLHKPSTGVPEQDMRLGRIQRAKVIGAKVKVSLVLPGGDQVVVDMPRGEFDQLAVKEGDVVVVDVHSARVFVEDYVI